MNKALGNSEIKKKKKKNCNYIKAIVMLIIVINHCICIYALSNRGGVDTSTTYWGFTGII